MAQESFLKKKQLQELSAQELRELHPVLEGLIATNPRGRREALDDLVALDAHRRSPLAAAFLVSRIRETDLNLRIRILKALRTALLPEDEQPVDGVQTRILDALWHIDEADVLAMLQASILADQNLDIICDIFNKCSHSGDLLAAILLNGRVEVAVRAKAAEAIGRIGFLQAIPAIENLKGRLISQSEGQLSMAFAPRTRGNAEKLLPVIQQTLQDLAEASL
jgi:hypothetical protein